MKTITITKTEYKKLKKIEKGNNELVEDIVEGIKAILKGKIKEV